MSTRHEKYSVELRKAMKAAGGLNALARLLGIKPQSIIKWHNIPAKRIIQIEKATGIPRQKLAPELYE